MLTLTRNSLFRRTPVRVATAAVLAAALAGGLLQNAAPSHKAALPSIAAVCEQSVNTAEAAYRGQAPIFSAAHYTPVAPSAAAQRAALLAGTRQAAVANCKSKLNATQTGWSYLPARMVEIAVDSTITFAAMTIFCSYTGPAGCAWGVRFAAFTGAFFGSFVFQYLTDGAVDWKSAGFAFMDAFTTMITYSAVSHVEEQYIGQGVRAFYRGIGQKISAAFNKMSMSWATNYVQSASDWIYNNVLAATTPGTFPGAYHGGGSIEPVLDSSGGQLVADHVQLRDEGTNTDVYGWNDTTYDLHSTNGGIYYDFDIQAVPNHFSSDGADAYLIAQGNFCLSHDDSTYSAVYGTPCDINDYHQWWFADGKELMANNGKCLNQTSGGMWLTDCDGETYLTNPNTKDDQFLVSSPTGNAIPDTISRWHDQWRYYAGA